nr:hypothetical protein [Tanacetum cinerariifolium]
MQRCMHVLLRMVYCIPSNCIDPNHIYLPLIVNPQVVHDTIFNERPPTKVRKFKGMEVVFDPYQMVLFEMKLDFKKWETIRSENAISLSGNKDHLNVCLVCILYFLANQNRFNLAYYIVKRMASVIKKNFMVLPYAMLLTCFYRHVLSIHLYPTPNIHILVDHVMVPLTEGRAQRIMIDGKRPHPGEELFEEMSMTLVLAIFLGGFFVDEEALEVIFEMSKEGFVVGFL